MFASA